MNRHTKRTGAGFDVAPDLEVHDVSAGSHSKRLRRKDDAHAFIPDPYDMTANETVPDDSAIAFAEELAEEYVTSLTGNVDVSEQQLDQASSGEYGGPYTLSSANEEIAMDDGDLSNPPDATREPFPSPMRGNGEPAIRR